MSESLRWGILATGWIARRFTSDAQLAGLDIAAVGSRSPDAAQRFAEEFGIPHAHGSYEDLVDNDAVDIVYIATPHPWHYTTTMLALQAGKHVLVEKPFTLNKPEAEALRDASRSRNLLVSEAMWTRYLPHMARIREIVSSGGIGEVRALSADHTQKLSKDPAHRINALDLGGGALLDLGVYPIAFARDILGAPRSIQATARLGTTGVDTEVAVVMTHDSGSISTCLASSRSAGPNTAYIIGTEGRIVVDPLWFTASGFTHYGPEGEVLERYSAPQEGHGMHYQAIAAEEYVASGNLNGELMTLDDSVEIMGTLDEIRSQIGVRYPAEDTWDSSDTSIG